MKSQEFLEKHLEELKSKLRRSKKELSKFPPGKLYRELRGSEHIYYQAEYNPVTKRVKRKLINSDPEMIARLARKAYITKEIQILENDIALFEKFLQIHRHKYIEPTVENVVNNLPARLSDLPAEIFLDMPTEDLPFTLPANITEAYAKMRASNIQNPARADYSRYDRKTVEWAQLPYTQSDYLAERKIHKTERGLRVRSKSEVIIAEKLYKHQIPFRYEEALSDGHVKMIPDFTLPNIHGEIYYWEHCGLPNDPDYMKHHKQKLEIYERLGIFPWKNLIVTYDDEHGSIDSALIESEICNKLL